jgi:hypothetical protein
MWRFDRRENQMTDKPGLPLRCICGYQNKINKLKSDLEIAERRLTELGNNLQHAITENYELRNKLGRASGDR